MLGVLLFLFYYVKVSGIPSGNKLIKTIRYPHMWRHILTCEDIDDFTDIKFVSLIVFKCVGVSSKHLRVFLESLRESSEIFWHLRKFSEILGKCSGTFVWPSEQLWKIFAALTREILFMPLEHKIHKIIFSPPCNILYMFKNIDLFFLFAAICWILYCLARHPEHQQRCRDEVDSILEQENDLQKLARNLKRHFVLFHSW